MLARVPVSVGVLGCQELRGLFHTHSCLHIFPIFLSVPEHGAQPQDGRVNMLHYSRNTKKHRSMGLSSSTVVKCFPCIWPSCV